VVPLLAASLLSLAGCGGKPTESANSVSGKVTLDGAKVAGQVIFVGPDNKELVPAAIKLDGTYQIADVPPGKYKVLVRGAGSATGPAPKDSALPKMETGGGAAPPAKYAAVTTSDLTYEVKGGKETYNIELKN